MRITSGIKWDKKLANHDTREYKDLANKLEKEVLYHSRTL